MKICMVSKEGPGDERTSIGTYVLEAGKALKRSGHEVWLITKDPGGDNRRELAEIPGFHRVLYAGEGVESEETMEFLQGKPYYEYSDLVHRTLMSLGETFDYIEFSNFEAEGIVPIMEQRLMGSYEGTLLGVMLHSPTYECLKHDGQLHRFTYDLRHACDMEDYAVRNAPLRLGPSAFILETLSDRLDLPGQSGCVLRYPLDFPAEYPDPPSPRKSLKELSFVYFGRVEPRKGVMHLVKAFADLPNLRLKIVGGDTMYDPFGRSFKAYVQKRARGNVAFLDPFPREKVLEIVEKADVCIIPSLWDNFPHACIEAMGMARVVIGGKNGGMSEMIVHGESGFLVDGSDPAAIVRCIREDLAGSLHRLDEIGRNAAERIRKIADPAAYSEKLAELVEISKPGGCPTQEKDAEKRKVTVVIPFFEGRGTIGEAVDSALGQTYPRIEVLVIDDGSPLPDAEEILGGLAAKDPRVRIVRKENGGLGSARNRGILESTGDYLVFLDDDDVIHPHYAEWGVAAMERRPELGFIVPYTKFNGTEVGKQSFCFNPMTFNWSTALVINQFGTAGAFFRKSIFLENDISYDEELIAYEDWALWMDLARKGVKGEVLPRICYDYRIRKGSMMGSKGWPNHLALVGLLIHKHFAVSGEREMEILTILNQVWGGVAAAARFKGARQEGTFHDPGRGKDFSPIPIEPTPLAPVPLRHKVVDALAEMVGKVPFLSRFARKVLGGIAWFFGERTGL